MTRRASSLIAIGAVNFRGGTTFLPEKYVWKINKMPEFYMILAWKIRKNTQIFVIFFRKINNSGILHDFCPKMPEFYIIIARKIFFPNFRGHVPPCPPPAVSYACVHCPAYKKSCYNGAQTFAFGSPGLISMQKLPVNQKSEILINIILFCCRYFKYASVFGRELMSVVISIFIALT